MDTDNELSQRVTSIDFENTVLKSRKPVLVDFSAAWCGPCRAIAPIIERLASEYADAIAVAKVDVDSEYELTSEYHVMSVPTVMLVAGGEIRRIFVGARSEHEYRAGIEALLH